MQLYVIHASRVCYVYMMYTMTGECMVLRSVDLLFFFSSFFSFVINTRCIRVHFHATEFSVIE